MPSLNKLLQWLILTLLFPLIFLNIWLAFRVFRYFQPLVTILVLACLLAFILNYPVSLLQQRGIKRNYAIALVFISSLVVLVALGITLVPVALEQFSEMTKLFPQWIDSSEQNLQIFSDRVFGNRFNINLRQIFSQLLNQLPNEAEQIGDKLFSIVIDTIDGLSEALITVVLTIYLLIDGERIWEGLFKKLPLGFAQKIQQSLQQNFQNYLIGQVTLALLMGVSQTIMFLALNVRFGLLFGLGIGILSLIPFGDVVSLAIITLIIASHNFWLAVKILVVAVIIDQLIDQAIAPRLLGRFTGLRPIWVIVSLLVGTYLGGVLGLLIAVSVAGFIKDATDGFVTISANPSNPIESEELPEMLANESTLQ
ncbi:AI-2E family transporter [Chlorogloeopsis sp. ULAP01]|uniref:AI-2E family transporter n=1 Tax=Chlorogloeopsis sp. ULAP01 TaxID=3056483 RepID=UPI0025AADBC7|nr:AI-2E family transporter [Chlorogloeopsis sp. ULAP01]MDM9381905.1 AI-2E family transporter [Chlorogloeopsis sp. ULAP01]